MWADEKSLDVSCCELAGIRPTFSGKRVRVRAIYRYAFEVQRLVRLLPRAGSKNMDRNRGRTLRSFPKNCSGSSQRCCPCDGGFCWPGLKVGSLMGLLETHFNWRLTELRKWRQLGGPLPAGSSLSGFRAELSFPAKIPTVNALAARELPCPGFAVSTQDVPIRP